MSSSPEPPVLGGRYVLGPSLGRGGMAEVFRARDTLLDREVAVKVFRDGVDLPGGDLRRAAEVRTLARLAHPHLVTLYDAGRDDEAGPFGYLVTELIEGQTLAQRIPLPPERVAALGAQLADALSYVHERGIVHRDLKPANVLLDPTATTAKLADFGVVRLAEGSSLTAHGTTLGTPNYLSPEQASGGPIGAASDVYSLGLVLIEALTGAKAFPGTGVEAAVARLHRDPVVPADLDPALHDVLVAMTARDPDTRPTAAQAAARLGGRARIAAPTAVLATPPEPSGRRRRLWLAGVLAVAVAVLAVLFGTLGGSPSTAGQGSPSYPAVAGLLGTHLRALERATPSELAEDVLAVSRSAGEHQYRSALSALEAMSTAADTAHEDGQLSGDRYDTIKAEIAVVGMDLRRLIASSAASTSATASTSPTPTLRRSTSAPAPIATHRTQPKPPGHGGPEPPGHGGPRPPGHDKKP